MPTASALFFGCQAVRNRGIRWGFGRRRIARNFWLILGQALFETIEFVAETSNGLEIVTTQAILLFQQVQQILNRQAPGSHHGSRLHDIDARLTQENVHALMLALPFSRSCASFYKKQTS
jgi:hypothetical protein